MEQAEQAMKKRIDSLEKDLSRVRTGRATVAILDGVKVNYYGNPTPVNQVASLSTPDARTIVIAPFEKKLIGDIERAIHMADIGVQPSNDGNVIRLPIPPLNEERRKEIAKSIRKLAEETKINLRKVRQDGNAQIKKMEKDKAIAEDESKRLQKDIQTLTDRYVQTVDERVSKKEAEILSF